MNVTEAYEKILHAAEREIARSGFKDRAEVTALRCFRTRVYKMKSRLEKVRARLAKNLNRPACLR
jgi:hypothetical protein